MHKLQSLQQERHVFEEMKIVHEKTQQQLRDLQSELNKQLNQVDATKKQVNI